MNHRRALGVSDQATQEDIRAAYKASALKWHPDRCLTEKERATSTFVEINTAYRALLREHRRAQRTQSSHPFKEKENLPSDSQRCFNPAPPRPVSHASTDKPLTEPKPPVNSPWKHTDLEKNSPKPACSKGLKQSKPTSRRLHTHSSDFSPKPSPRRQKAEEVHRPEVILLSGYTRPLIRGSGILRQWTCVLKMSLEELFHGKKFSFRIIRCLASGRKKNVILDVDIPPGCQKGTKIIFRGAGHERRGGSRQDIVFRIEEIQHERFSRLRADLTMDARFNVTSADDMNGADVCFQGVDGQELIFTVPYPMNGQLSGTHLFPSGGMPTRDGDGRGELYFRWEIVLPPHSKPSPWRWEALKRALRLKI